MCKNFVKVSLLLESVGLTMDKVMRCAAGIHEAWEGLRGTQKVITLLYCQRIKHTAHNIVLPLPDSTYSTGSLVYIVHHCSWWFSGSVQIRRHVPYCRDATRGANALGLKRY